MVLFDVEHLSGTGLEYWKLNEGKGQHFKILEVSKPHGYIWFLTDAKSYGTCWSHDRLTFIESAKEDSNSRYQKHRLSREANPRTNSIIHR